MIKFDRFTLANGLKVIVHKDESTPIVAMNILYDVGARDENPERTGFAHLFEHLMFGGSVNIPKYDEPLERSGGENNAFTNNDITNYYLTIPLPNLETAFWLESDRMLSLAFTKKSLDVQRNVVIEEFKQSYLNQPYGDIWLLLRPLAYKVHPYQWSTIGKDISHIANAKMADVKAFFIKYYCPNNAIMTVAGNVETERIKELCEKWFAPIPAGNIYKRKLPEEPTQNEYRRLKVKRDVPFDSIYRVYKMCARMDDEYYATDIVSDILAGGDSSRLYKTLVKKLKLFSKINAYQLGHLDKGLFVITGQLVKKVDFATADKALDEILNEISTSFVKDEELEKVKNRAEANFILSEMNVLNKAMNLSFYELLGNAGLINNEIDLYKKVNTGQVKAVAAELFKKTNCSALYYKSKSI
jgi:zinc protease